MFVICSLYFVIYQALSSLKALIAALALLRASVVSPALPKPTPTLPFLLPMMSATEKEKRLPPATARDTRRMFIIFWSNSLLARGGRPPRRGARAGAAATGAATGVNSEETSEDGSETSGGAIISCSSFI